MTHDASLKTIAMSLCFRPNVDGKAFEIYKKRLEFNLTIPFNYFYFTIENITYTRKNGTRYDKEVGVVYRVDISEKQQEKMIEKWGISNHPSYVNNVGIYLDVVIENVDNIDIDSENKRMRIPNDIKKVEFKILLAADNAAPIQFLIEVIFNDRIEIVQYQLKKILYWDYLTGSSKVFDLEKMNFTKETKLYK